MTIGTGWDGQADVVLVGGGGSGLIAACVAARRGCKVMLFEKAAYLGGTTALAIGSIMVAGSSLQLRAGIKDTAVEHADDLARVAADFGITDNAELRVLMTTHAAEAFEFLRSIGVVFADPLPQPPHRHPRLHQVMPGSSSYVEHLKKACEQAGVEFHLGTEVSCLVSSGGQVTGVETIDASRTVRRIRARKGVVLASGDIAGNADLVETHIGQGLRNVEVLNPHCTGDGHLMGAAVGGKIVSRHDYRPGELAQMRFVKPERPNWTQGLPCYQVIAWTLKSLLKYPLTVKLLRPFVLKFLTTALGVDRGVFVEGALLINKRGDRFCDELAGTILQDVGNVVRAKDDVDGVSRAPNLLLPQQPDGMAYIVFDDRIARQFSAWPHFISTAPGVAYAYVDDYRRGRPDIFRTAKTLADLALSLGMNPTNLEKSVASSRFGGANKVLSHGPYYALGPIKSWLLVTPVGLAVNQKLGVLDHQGAPIPGLYAAGGVGQGGFSNTGHGHGLCWAFTSGMLAGQNVSQAATKNQQDSGNPAVGKAL